jgi:hypothetical protein
MPIQLILDLWSQTFSLERFCNDDSGLPLGISRLMQPLNNTLKIMPIHLHCIPPKSLPLLGNAYNIMLKHRGITLPQPINIHNPHQILQLIKARKIGRLPHTSLRNLPIPHHTIHPIPNPIKVLTRIGHPSRHSQPLPKRPGRHINIRDSGCWVSLDDGVFEAEGQKLLSGEDAGFAEG